GGSAAMGYRYLIGLAVSQAGKGDVVILQLEPDILRWRERGPSNLALKIDPVLRGHLAERVFGKDESEGEWSILRPGAKFLGALLGKVVRGGPIYRYQLAEVQPNGVATITTSVPNADVEGFSSMEDLAEEQVLDDFRRVREYAEATGFQIFYALPWECFRAGLVPAMQEESERFLKRMEGVIPVLRDERGGAVSENNWFLDTGYHLSLEAGRIRSVELGRALKRALGGLE
ncbi:hypothetical protein N9Z83_01500, partial [Akkermansiaceae bacterium]|nr:hypothetical protein [Akkermansiaceae bacterium]